MRRRPTATASLLVPGLVALALLAAACGSGGSSGPATAVATGKGSTAQLVRSTASRADATVADGEAGGATTRQVAARLYPVLAKGAGTGNLAYSPASIALALGMARAGFQGESAQQVDAFLGSSDPATLHEGLNGLATALAARSGTTTDDDGQKATVTVRTANSFWGQRGIAWKRPFLDTLARDYGVGMRQVDYQHDADGARTAVNHWVADQTEGKIPALIQPGTFDDRTRLTLVDAIYLAAPWAQRFDAAGKQAFTTAIGSTVPAPMMQTSFDQATYRTGSHWQAVTVPYAGRKLAMTLLVPDAGSLAAVERQVTPALLGQLARGTLDPAGNRAVDLTMPTFDLDSRPDLTSALQELGVKAPFQGGSDLDPITTDPDATPLALSAVVHQATVQVDEKGTVAAAATADVFVATGARIEPTPVRLTIDRPFLFVISDQATGATLFLGRVADPTKR